jgi:hypothetical protein
MPQHVRRLATVLAALVALLALVAVSFTSAVAKGHGHDDGHGHRGPTIAEVRSMPLGTVVTVVTVEGTVTTPAGVFDSSFFDVGFAIQDSTAGIFVSFPDVSPSTVSDRATDPSCSPDRRSENASTSPSVKTARIAGTTISLTTSTSSITARDATRTRAAT